ncbi:L-lactate permease [Candidatus Woesearchaeota archaeon]|nr:L-lactate permease [Candidatus Woesearchaeota archaeon]
MDVLLTILGLFPIVLVLVLMGVFNMAAKKVMPIAAIVAIIIAIFFWDMPSNWLYASIAGGVLTALDIILIVLGALLLIEVMQKSKRIDIIISNLKSISGDSRVELVIIGWVFVCFLEGIAGFGTPTAIVAPLLVALGYPTIAAVAIPLMFDTVPTTFGAVGVPVNYGIPTAIPGISDATLQQVAIYSAFLHSIVALVLPLAALLILTRFFTKEKSWMLGLKAWRFALLGSISFIVPYLLTAIFIGPELPSIVGSIIALIITITFAKKRWLVPKEEWHFKKIEGKDMHVTKVQTMNAWLPYGLVAIILVVTRIKELGVQDLVRSVVISWSNMFGTTAGYSNPILYNPGTIFIFVAVICAIIFGMKKEEFFSAFTDTIKKLVPAIIALVFTIILVKVLLNSGSADMKSMLILPAEALAGVVGNLWYAFAPFIGSLGSFISGSNTVSNILFSALHEGIASDLGKNLALLLALQAVGGAIGNMICIHNIVAGCSTVGIAGQESKILRVTIIPSLIYALIIGVVGMILVGFI